MTRDPTVSLNETEATAKKAARGAGFTWGMAEEAGKATRWLCRHGVDGCADLARLLSIDESGIARASCVEAGTWASGSGSLCPIHLGASMADRAHELNAQGWQATDVVCPAFLLPFAADIAARMEQVIEISGQDFSAVTDGVHLRLAGPLPDRAVSVAIRIAQETVPPAVILSRATPAKSDWALLHSLAHRTYAPATEASRMTGAGAGLSDND